MDYGNSTEIRYYPTETKAPTAARDFTVTWAADLDGETIVTSSWTTDGLTNVQDSETATTTTIRLSGGSEGVTYRPVNTITTSGGQTLVKGLVIAVRGQ